MHHAHGLDRAPGVLRQPRADRRRVHRMAPVAFQEVHLQAQPPGQLAPEAGEMAGLHHEHPVAGRQRIDQRGLPGARAGRGKDHHGRLRLEHLLDAAQHRQPQRAEYRSAVIDGGLVDGAQDAVGHIGRPRNLQKMPAGRMVVQGKHA
ncbi:hypothetical protein D9M68_561810 [compost metagenome]